MSTTTDPTTPVDRSANGRVDLYDDHPAPPRDTDSSKRPGRRRWLLAGLGVAAAEQQPVVAAGAEEIHDEARVVHAEAPADEFQCALLAERFGFELEQVAAFGVRAMIANPPGNDQVIAAQRGHRVFRLLLWLTRIGLPGLPMALAAKIIQGDKGKIGRASVGKECRSRWAPYH